jgi:hypothetical protein
MFRIASVVLITASLSSVTTAQIAEQGVQKQQEPIKQAPSSVKTVAEPPVKDEEPKADGSVNPAPSDLGPPPSGTASLKMAVNGGLVQAYVHSSQPGFVGIVGLSLTKDLIYPLGMLPLLRDAVVMAYGATDHPGSGPSSAPVLLACGVDQPLRAGARHRREGLLVEQRGSPDDRRAVRRHRSRRRPMVRRSTPTRRPQRPSTRGPSRGLCGAGTAGHAAIGLMPRLRLW